ncbi:MAG: thymidine phosphorylase, partial [Kiritimatiellae bacterium]|nr:thymidine phosphorylase [Kiritimatiellia bacterium]
MENDGFVPQWTIEAKRDGRELSEADIREWIARYSAGAIPDYQMAAFAMAVYFRGMSPAETLALTDAMRRSGDSLSWDALSRPTADKHSTGGIGDKISLPLAPLVASCGVSVPMISGRGLGTTGGTLDKLESIPGYDAGLSAARFRRVVRDVGCSIVGQTARLAPADRKLYALRDVTGTVPSIPLITASILSKKLAEGAGTLVFDVKCGSGAFMKTPREARALARSLLSVARGAGRNAGALVTRMSEPLGRSAGNALEVAESVDLLRGEGPAYAMELTMLLGE